MSLNFEWSERKARANVKKHGISFEEASTVFLDDFSMTIDDPLHSDDEERLITLGHSDKQHLLVVVHTERDNAIRIISARKATAHERHFYEERNDE